MKKAKKSVARKTVSTKAGTNKVSAVEKKRLFVEAMLTNGGNLRQSAIAAGYSDGRAADKAGERLSQDVVVRQMLEIRRGEVLALTQAETVITVQDVLKSLKRDLDFDPKQLYADDGKIKPVHELDDETRLALRGFKVNAAGFPEFKYPERTAVRDQAMKHLGMFKLDNAQRAVPAVMIGQLTVGLEFDKVRARSRTLKHAS